jgi:hypothetical protein
VNFKQTDEAFNPTAFEKLIPSSKNLHEWASLFD